MADTFPDISPSFDGSSRSTSARVLKASFGNGYSQRAADGLNNLNQTIPLVWTYITEDEKNTIVDFLSSKLGAGSFYFTFKGDSEASLVVCEKWSETPVSGPWWTVSATFEKVFDL